MVTLVNRAKMTTATIGTGTITLGSASSGYQTFAAAGVSNANSVRYVIEDGSNWEIGYGTYTSIGTTLTRTPTESSNGGSAINLSGLAVVYISATSSDLVPYNSGSPIALAYGGTNAVTSAGAAANLLGYTSTPTTGGLTTLYNTDTQYQLFTGTSSQNVQLPVTSTLTTGWSFHIVNNSTGILTVNASGGGSYPVCTIIPQTTAMVTCIATATITASDWEFGFTDFGSLTGTGSVVLSKDPTFSGAITETVYAVTGTTPALSAANGTIQTWTLTANSSPTSSLTNGQSITLMINDGTSYQIITWPSVVWVNNAGLAPTLSLTGYTVVVLWNASGTLYGAVVGNGT